MPPAGVRFDRRAGIQTVGHAEPSDLIVEHGSLEDGFSYVATPPRLVRGCLDALAVPEESFTFIDMGSGRGRVLLMASERPFRRVVGIEFAAELHEAATENIRRFPKRRMRCRDVTSLYGDAAAFTFPLDPLILYFNNPFSENVMTKVLQNLATSHQQQPRPIVVAYLQQAVEDPQHATDNLGLLGRQPFLTRRPVRFRLLDRIALRRFLVHMYCSPEALNLAG